MEAHGSQDIPSRHLTDILVTAQTIHGFIIGFFADASCPILGKPRFRCIIEHERHLMVWFVRMIVIIAPHKALVGTLEEGYQLLFKVVLAHQFYQTFHIVRDKPTLLIVVALYATLFVYIATFPRQPTPTFYTSTEPFDTIAPYRMIRLRLFFKRLRAFGFSLRMKQGTYAPIGVSIFQSHGQRTRRVSIGIVRESLYRIH